jgi:hypothetical protein
MRSTIKSDFTIGPHLSLLKPPDAESVIANISSIANQNNQELRDRAELFLLSELV